MTTPQFLSPTDIFVHRHLGPTEADVREMLALLGLPSLQALSDATVPRDIQLGRPLDIPPNRGEQAVLQELRDLAQENRIYRSYLGMGYYDCITPPVIQRNILRESRLVYAIHALSGGDCPGTAGSLGQFSDDGG